MLWPVRFVFKLAVPAQARHRLGGGRHGHRLLPAAARTAADAGASCPVTSSKPLAGDDLVAGPDIIETRSLSIDAAPSRGVAMAGADGLRPWWLVQLRQARHGHPQRRHASSPQFQDLRRGRRRAHRIPMAASWPGSWSPRRPWCSTSTRSSSRSGRSEASVAEHGGQDALAALDEEMPGGLQFAGALGGMAMPEFRATLGVRPRTGGRRTRHAPHRALPGLDGGRRAAAEAGHAGDGPRRLRHDPQAHARAQGASRRRLATAPGTDQPNRSCTAEA